jgi:molybdate transport system substrate-binding protein
MVMKTLGAVAAGLAVLVASATAAEISVISSVGMKAALDELGPQFEQSSHHKIKIAFGTAGPLKVQIEGGQTFDVAILTPALIEDLVKQGRVAPSPIDVARTGIGMAVKAGASKPDITTIDALKRTLLSAKSLVYSKEGQSGTAMVRVVERLGLIEDLKPKTVLETRSGASALAVVEGKAELGFSLISEILPVVGVDYAGPLPADMQTYVVFTAGLSPSLKEVAAAKSFVDFLKASGAVPVLKAKGMEPG